MNIQKLRIEALRAAVAVGIQGAHPSHIDVIEFADLYYQFLMLGEIPKRVRAAPPLEKKDKK